MRASVVGIYEMLLIEKSRGEMTGEGERWKCFSAETIVRINQSTQSSSFLTMSSNFQSSGMRIRPSFLRSKRRKFSFRP
jgi:hypothetical protein